MLFFLDYIVTFNRMITPYLLTALYWFLVFVFLIMALQAPDIFPLVGLLSHETGTSPMMLSLIGFIVALGILRIFFELMILAFKVYDVLLKIAENNDTAKPLTDPAVPTQLVDREQVRLSADEA